MVVFTIYKFLFILENIKKSVVNGLGSKQYNPILVRHTPLSNTNRGPTYQ
jgi:hypothetical protein